MGGAWEEQNGATLKGSVSKKCFSQVRMMFDGVISRCWKICICNLREELGVEKVSCQLSGH